MNNNNYYKKGIDIRKTTDKYKPLTDEEALLLANDVYDNYIDNQELFEDLKQVLNPDITEYSSSNRKPPNFVNGYLDKPFLEGGVPTRKKDRELYEAIMSGNYKFVEIEGGVRGGKDVIGLYSWSKYLMTCKEKQHLAIGSSLEHVLRTVLMSHGFGLWNNIPHGRFIRESVSGAQRGVYKFQDIYGREKEILFYGNEKENDGNKFQGFTLGSVYVNETLNQHIKGLDQALSRIGTSSAPLFIMTQNPEGQNAPFYLEFEKPKLMEESEIKRIELLRDLYKDSFEVIEKRLKFGHEDIATRERLLNEKGVRWRELEKQEVLKQFLAIKGKSHFRFLDTKDQIAIQEKLLEINFKYDAKIRDIPTQFFDEYLSKDDPLYNLSMKKSISFNRGEPNVNGIINSYNFYYAHYTVDDNMSMSDMQKNEFKQSYSEGSSYHDQKVLGLRRSTEGAVYASFNQENMIYGSLMDYDWSGKQRIFTIDPGFNDPTGITEKGFDPINGTLDYLTNRLIDFNIEYVYKKSLDVIYDELLKMIRAPHGNNRRVDAIIVDPSKPELISYLENKGWYVLAANNRNWTVSRKEKEISEEITPRELRGIPLASTAVDKRKIKVHEGCVELLKQIHSYTYDMIEDKNASNDDLVVHLKYDVNTLNITPMMWTDADLIEQEKKEGKDEKQRLYRNGNEENIERHLARKIAKAFSPFEAFEEREQDNEETNFFNYGDFFIN